MSKVIVSVMDQRFLRLIRKNVEHFMQTAAEKYCAGPGTLLDIAPQDHLGAAPFFPPQIRIQTLDMDPDSGCDFIGDICGFNADIPAASFDFIVCTEVLEHTLQPFSAVQELERLLKPGGLLFVSTPFNFRIHGPLPDCWRFTEHGLRALLSEFEIVELTPLNDPARDLMPIHHTVVARKPQGGASA